MQKIQNYKLNHQPPLVPCNIQETLNSHEATKYTTFIQTEVY